MIAIIDYKVGNLASVKRGFDRVGLDTTLVSEPHDLKDADCVILPGVGAFPDAMNDLVEKGFVTAIRDFVKTGKPLIGICLGMQLLFDSSTEFVTTPGLSLIPGTVEELDVELKIPHMGWNDLTIRQDDPSVSNITNGEYVYFVHSFYAKTDPKYIVADTSYGVSVPAIVRNNNVIGMQFHPEKSGDVGLRLLQTIKEMIR